VRTVLVCVRTTSAARDVAAVAGRLGLAAAVCTASTASEAMRRLAERPAGIVLADTAVARPDPVGFTRAVLARAPGAVVIFLGPDRPGLAAAVVAAGARALLPYDGRDPVGVVAKAAFLLGFGVAAGAVVPSQRRDHRADDRADDRAGDRVDDRADDRIDGRCKGQAEAVKATRSAAAHAPTSMAPHEPAPAPTSTAPAAHEPTPAGAQEGTRAAAGGVRLTEREVQVLRGMADGKSNAEIGRDIFVSEDTVKTHARRLFRKLGARDRAHAVAAGFRAGLVA
jgi:DNA-binding NarL/FixJ family response regulator